jgi:tRNA(Arg) A34 adenosine deaminase TadA
MQSINNANDWFCRLNHHVEVAGGVLQRESRTLLQNFFRPKRQGTASKHDHRA